MNTTTVAQLLYFSPLDFVCPMPSLAFSGRKNSWIVGIKIVT